MDDPWLSFLYRARRSNSELPGSLLCIDPGETTGWCEFREGQLARIGQRSIQGSVDFHRLLTSVRPTHIVVENYKIYAHKAAEHIGSEVVTIRYIGAVQLLAAIATPVIPVVLQMAHQAKGFVTNAKLREWGLYQPGARHANDAIRHGVYFLLFARY